MFYFPPKLLVEVAPGAGGLNSSANYVLLSTKASQQRFGVEISRILVMANVTNRNPRCRPTQGETIECEVALLTPTLKALISYEVKPKDADLVGYLAQSEAVANEISNELAICNRQAN
jgi:hypothetical protein